MAELSELAGYVKTASKYKNNGVEQLIKDPFNEETFISSVSALSEAPNCCENIKIMSTGGMTPPSCFSVPLITATFWPERICRDKGL